MVADREMARAAGAGLAKTALGPRLRAAAAADHRHHGAGLPWLDQQVPLNKDDTNLSAVALLNDIAPNGISAFSWALADRDNDKRFAPVTQREGQLLNQRFLGRPGDGLEPFMAVTALNPAARERPPHVVLQVMESMGHHLSSLDAPGRDLLARCGRIGNPTGASTASSPKATAPSIRWPGCWCAAP